MDINEKFVQFNVHWVVKEYPTFDEFMDWLDIDVGIDRKKMINTYEVVADKFKEAGYYDRAVLTQYKLNSLLKNESA